MESDRRGESENQAQDAAETLGRSVFQPYEDQLRELIRKAHAPVLGLLGGCIWGLGMVFNLVAASFTGVAISYAIGQSAPMVAALWGVLAWKEFNGSGSQAKIYLVFMFVFYALAILLVAHANG